MVWHPTTLRGPVTVLAQALVPATAALVPVRSKLFYSIRFGNLLASPSYLLRCQQVYRTLELLSTKQIVVQQLLQVALASELQLAALFIL